MTPTPTPTPAAFDVIGDVHGCLDELVELLTRLGWRVTGGRADPDGSHPDGRTAVFLGDLVDRGPDAPGVLRLVMAMVAAGRARCVLGNHDAKLLRKLEGRAVQVAHGLERTLAQLEPEPPAFHAEVARFLAGLPLQLALDAGRLVVAHAGMPAHLHGRATARARAFALYGDTTGATDADGLPVRRNWAARYRGEAIVVYGHTPVADPVWQGNTVCIDTGCAFGGALTALRYPERALVAVPARAVYTEPARPLGGLPGE